MMKWLLASWLVCIGITAQSQTIVAAHAIRARSIITLSDLATLDSITPGGIADQSLLVGKEARVNLYAGRAIALVDVGPPAILERNQLVVMVYITGPLSIRTDGRILARAGIGESVQVMNMDSRVTVMGRVLHDGTIEVNR